MSGDKLAAELAAIGENHREAIAERGNFDLVDRADYFFACVQDVPGLLAAVEAVLELHRPVSRGRVMNCCEGCEDACEGGRACHEWPCPTYEAITDAMSGGPS